MCQGIFHATSSVFHALMCKVIESAITKRFGKLVKVKSFCTSDDASRIIRIHPNLNQIEVIRIIHSIIDSFGILFNILRNNSKSAFNFHVAEFNSIFFLRGVMATPNIKQRISKIDVGAGANHVEDYMSCLSASANFFTVGGSYAGTITLSVLNLVLHTEQWNRWEIVEKPDKYYKPVELGGFPVIEPFSTCLSGAVSNLYLRSRAYVSDDEYARIFSTIITENPEEVSLSDYWRVPKSLSEDANSIKIFKSTGALGLFSLVRTDKKLSQFEHRHQMSKWKLPDSFLTLKKYSSDPKHFIYQIYKNGCMSLFSESEGVNSFYKRFTDPWLSAERKCIRISKKSILSILGFNSNLKYSYDDINLALDKIDINDSAKILKSFKSELGYSEFANSLISQLKPRLSDSAEIQDYLLGQSCAEYVKPSAMPATSRVTLRGSGALDHEKYVADLIKILSGEKSRLLISEIYNDYETFDKLPSNKDCPEIELKDSVLIAENSIHAFDKYIKRNTKMITAGKPDSLSSLVTLVLKSRFLEQYGIRLTGSISLIGDRSHAFSYTSWYRRLNEKSQEYSNKFVSNSAKATYAEVVKYGLITKAPVITPKDHFEVSDFPAEEKRVIVNAKSRSGLVSFCKTWVSAIASYTFDFETLSNLYDNKLLSHTEFRVGEESFVRCASSVYLNIRVNGLGAIHLINIIQDGDETRYRHIFLIESNIRECNIESEIILEGEPRKWLTSLQDFLNSPGTKYASYDYKIGNHNDYVRFETIDMSTSFKLEILPFTSTIAFCTPSMRIPICYSNVKRIDELKVGYVATHENFVNASKMFVNVIGEYADFDIISPKLAESLQFIMHRTNSSSTLKSVNSVLSNIGSNFSFDSKVELDIFRSLLLSEGFGSKTVNTSRLNQHVNNLFKTSAEGGSYLARTTVEERVAITLDEHLLDRDDEESLSDMEFNETEQAVDQQEAEANLFEDSDDNESEGEYNISLVDIDDVDFDAFSDDEILPDGEELFANIEIIDSEEDEDQITIKSSRTGITINPNQEFPYAFYSYIKKWSSTNKIFRFMGCPAEIQSRIDIAKLYLQTLRLTGSAPPNLIARLTKEESVEYPCPLSDLVVIKNVSS